MYYADSPVIPRLLQGLADPDASVRQVAAWVLRRFSHPSVRPALEHALQDPDQMTRTSVVRALGKLGDKQAVAPLQAVLGNHAELPQIRRAAAQSLGTLGDPQAVDILLPYLRDPLVELRSGAAWGLRKLQDRRALPALVERMEDPAEDPTVRNLARSAVQQIDHAHGAS